MFASPWLSVNLLEPQTSTNIYMVWTVLVGVIARNMIIFNHVTVTRRPRPRASQEQHTSLTTTNDATFWTACRTSTSTPLGLHGRRVLGSSGGLGPHGGIDRQHQATPQTSRNDFATATK